MLTVCSQNKSSLVPLRSRNSGSTHLPALGESYRDERCAFQDRRIQRLRRPASPPATRRVRLSQICHGAAESPRYWSESDGTVKRRKPDKISVFVNAQDRPGPQRRGSIPVGATKSRVILLNFFKGALLIGPHLADAPSSAPTTRRFSALSGILPSRSAACALRSPSMRAKRPLRVCWRAARSARLSDVVREG